jgi:hypothetical protein
LLRDYALQEWHLIVVSANDWSMETRTLIHSLTLCAWRASESFASCHTWALKTLFLHETDNVIYSGSRSAADFISQLHCISHQMNLAPTGQSFIACMLRASVTSIFLTQRSVCHVHGHVIMWLGIFGLCRRLITLHKCYILPTLLFEHDFRNLALVPSNTV